MRSSLSFIYLSLSPPQREIYNRVLPYPPGLSTRVGVFKADVLWYDPLRILFPRGIGALRIMFGFFLFFTLLGGLNAYITLRLWQWLRCLRPGLGPGWGVGLFVFLLGLLMLGFLRSRLPVGPGVKYALNVTGSVWMGVFIYLLLFLLAGDALLLSGRLLRLIPAEAMPRGRLVAVSAALVLAVLVSVGGVLHGRRLSIARYDVPAVTPMEGELRIVLLTDLHLGAVGSEARLPGIVDQVNALEPDVICIAGDFFDNDMAAVRRPDTDAALLRQLRAPLGVYMCPGNHDAGASRSRMLDFLGRCGITLLAEEAAEAGGRLTLVGRADRSPIGLQLTGHTRGDTRELMERVAGTLPTVVMDHNPAGVDDYDVGDLILCGHTHKGQIFPGNLFTRRLYTVDYGHYRRDEAAPHVIVSSGAGTWGMPMRVGTNCEVVLIRLLGQSENK